MPQETFMQRKAQIASGQTRASGLELSTGLDLRAFRLCRFCRVPVPVLQYAAVIEWDPGRLPYRYHAHALGTYDFNTT